MAVLITGGAGYIGSHVARLLRERGREIVVLDTLERGRREAVLGAPLVVGDIADGELVEPLSATTVSTRRSTSPRTRRLGESMEQPGRYFANNVTGSHRLVDALQREGVDRIVFSSSCSVYGTPAKVPVDESTPFHPESVYGETKRMMEDVLRWYGVCHGVRSVSLRYFNAAGRHPDGVIGEDWSRTENLVPLAMKATLGLRPPLQVFGTDYPTPDGTAIRDYIHIEDLADAHLRASSTSSGAGRRSRSTSATGIGSSVREVVDTIAAAAGRAVPHEDVGRRPR